MEQKLKKLLSSQGHNYILPFYWQHGEDEKTIRDMMRAIHECGIGAVCVECRPHPDFCGPKWWTDMDIIMDEARNREMKVWLLDDAHFPTGYANGALEDIDPKEVKQYIEHNTVDVLGGTLDAEINIETLCHHPIDPFGGDSMLVKVLGNKRQYHDDELLAVIAVPLVENTKFAPQVLNLTDKVENGMLYWDAPAGMWRIHVIYKTRNAGGRDNYINIIDEDSCRIQIDSVYEPHYARYAADFGKTFAGFFSDEPCFGNSLGFDWNESIGKNPKMALPWNKDVPLMLEERLGANWKEMLPALWTDCSDDDFNAKARYAYMDTVTKLVEKNFSYQIGNWCQERGVEYIGHIVEDNNQHSRLGSSLGHFFRALGGQHMAGIDDIGGQVLPNGEDHTRRGLPEDGEFYHFALGKLGSSHAHIDPKKQGRCMCEIFGAYGWSESVRMMKYIADHFLVRGVNYFVPHAFTGKEFPDPDCPPHFYAQGENPQYRHFGKLCSYMNRVSELITGGTHIAPVAVLYHGEAEWSGRYMFLQKPARVLMENQIDFDILPSDLFADMNSFRASFDGKLNVNSERFGALVIPYSQYVTKKVAEFAIMAANSHYPVIFVDGRPEGICDPCSPETEKRLLSALSICPVVELKSLASYLRLHGIFDISVSTSYRRLRYYHYRHEGDLYFFSNEDVNETFEGDITLPITGDFVAYDAMENVLRPIDATAVESGTRLHIKLEPYQMMIVSNQGFEGEVVELPECTNSELVAEGPWQLSFAENKEYPNFHSPETMTELKNVGRTHPNFSGFMRYEKDFNFTGNEKVLSVDELYDCAELYVNGEPAGMKICPPYRWDIRNLIRPGNNHICIDVANTLARKVAAMPSQGPMGAFGNQGPVEPSGIIGKIRFFG